MRDNFQREAIAQKHIKSIAKQRLPLDNLKNIVRALWDIDPHFVAQLQTAVDEVLEGCGQQ